MGSALAGDYPQTVAEMAELAGGLAHELRNPLSTMMINLGLLAEDLQDSRASVDDVRRRALIKVETLQREAQRLQSLFDDFLSLTTPCTLQRQESDLNAIVGRLVEFFEPLARGKGIQIHVSVPQEPVRCAVDEKLLSQAMLNLVINAQEAMPDGGVLTLSVAKDKGYAVLSVQDTGLGIAQEDCDRVFRPFFSTKNAGTGLGLSTAQRTIHEHGGTLDVASQLGEGTAFTIRLPLKPPSTIPQGGRG